MLYIDSNIDIAWTPAPPVWFALEWMKKPVPWFEMEFHPIGYLTDFEEIERRRVYHSLVDDLLVTFDDQGLLSVGRKYFLDYHELGAGWCDEDGLPNDASYGIGGLDNKGCVWVDARAEMLERRGDFVVEKHLVNAESQVYERFYDSPHILKMYFPEALTASLDRYYMDIKLGCCDGYNDDTYNLLGSVYIKGISVTMKKGSWVDILVHKKAYNWPEF